LGKKQLGIKTEKLGIKENFSEADKFGSNFGVADEIEENFDVISSPYIELNPNVNLNATTLEDLDDFEDSQNELINQDNIYVDPIQPLFLPKFNPDKGNKKVEKKKHLDMSVGEFLQDISKSYLDIIDDTIEGNYKDFQDLLLKNNRPLAIALLLIILSIFFVFFIPFNSET
jgi:hypothetical protein